MTRRLSTLFLDRYNDVPYWVVVPQLFLALGWARAAVAHAIEPGWWAGDGVHRVLTDIEPDRLPGLGTMIHVIADATAPQTAAIVIGLQVVVAVLLALNLRPLLGLTLGCAMNTAFIVAGAVNPSIFYLVLSTVIGLWSLERYLPVQRIELLAQGSILPALLAVVVLLPLARTLDPDHVIEDPALVLASCAGIVLVLSSMVLHRSAATAPTGVVADHDDDDSVDVLQLITQY